MNALGRHHETSAPRPPSEPAVRRHSTLTIVLHWTSVLAIVVSAVAVLMRELVEEKAFRILLLDIHKQLGLLVLILLGLRLIARLRDGLADHSGGMPPILHWAATLAHMALYALLFVMPILGIAVANAHSVQVKLFGLLPLPRLVEADSDLADRLGEFHTWGAWVLLALVVAHVAAACWHHWFRHDGVLAAMLPLVKPKSKND